VHSDLFANSHKPKIRKIYASHNQNIIPYSQKFLEILFNEYFGKIFLKFLVIFSFFATGLKSFKAPFCKNFFGKFLKFLQFPKIKFYENFWLYGIYITYVSDFMATMLRSVEYPSLRL